MEEKEYTCCDLCIEEFKERPQMLIGYMIEYLIEKCSEEYDVEICLPSSDIDNTYEYLKNTIEELNK